ncbi:alpha/beta fold hydrolase [Marinisporobacter balticus]|uniref:Alpha/beta hydrolase family protein n=1 Tax=Marinisporobacter balticus TaxID=2018667 RepID=A0A4R2K829_9FIRM|nr:alpha/beta fold hydrolase [Marinisporobacter balticus]TCO68067.1 alpha/beta hydrolase family protein [Marinisporobacter balticus]
MGSITDKEYLILSQLAYSNLEKGDIKYSKDESLADIHYSERLKKTKKLQGVPKNKRDKEVAQFNKDFKAMIKADDDSEDASKEYWKRGNMSDWEMIDYTNGNWDKDTPEAKNNYGTKEYESGMCCTVYRKKSTQEVVFAFRGTEPGHPQKTGPASKDLITDGAIADMPIDAMLNVADDIKNIKISDKNFLKKTDELLDQLSEIDKKHRDKIFNSSPQQMLDAEDWVDKVIKKNKLNYDKISFSGHSLGGGISQYMAYKKADHNVRSVTFNAPGILPIIKDDANSKPIKEYNMTNFVDENEMIGNSLYSLGETVYVKGAISKSIKEYMDKNEKNYLNKIKDLESYKKTYPVSLPGYSSFNYSPFTTFNPASNKEIPIDIPYYDISQLNCDIEETMKNKFSQMGDYVKLYCEGLKSLESHSMTTFFDNIGKDDAITVNLVDSSIENNVLDGLYELVFRDCFAKIKQYTRLGYDIGSESINKIKDIKDSIKSIYELYNFLNDWLKKSCDEIKYGAVTILEDISKFTFYEDKITVQEAVFGDPNKRIDEFNIEEFNIGEFNKCRN